MNMVSTKPVRHRFGEVSTEDVGQGSSGLDGGGGWGGGGWGGAPWLSCLGWRVPLGLRKSARFLRGNLTTPPGAAGAGTPEVSTRILGPRGPVTGASVWNREAGQLKTKTEQDQTKTQLLWLLLSPKDRF